MREVEHLSARHRRVDHPHEVGHRRQRVVVASHDEAAGRVGVEGGDDVAEGLPAGRSALGVRADLHVPAEVLQGASDVLRGRKKIVNALRFNGLSIEFIGN